MNRAIKIILGIVLFLMGCFYLSVPVLGALLTVDIIALVLFIVGIAELIYLLAAKHPKVNLISALMHIFLGLLLWAVSAFPTEPTLAGVAQNQLTILTIWLIVFGVWRIVQGVSLKKKGTDAWLTKVSVGVVALIAVVFMFALNAFAASEIAGMVIGTFLMIYGVMLIFEGLIKEGRRLSDEEISTQQNEAFYEFQKKLDEEDK